MVAHPDHRHAGLPNSSEHLSELVVGVADLETEVIEAGTSPLRRRGGVGTNLNATFKAVKDNLQ